MLIENPLNESGWAFPVLESIHLVGIVCGVGTVAIMNLRLLGVGISSPRRLWNQTMLVALGGLVVAISSGLLLFSIDPEMYYTNHAFRFKMVVLLAALVFYYTMVRRAAARDDKASVVASISLILFALVPLGGIFIGYL
jgi:hypothetical protein